MKKALKNKLSVFGMVVIVVGLGTVIGDDVIVKEGDLDAGNLTANTFNDKSIVGYWQFGGSAKDSSIYGNDGSFQGGAHAQKDVLYLDGYNDGVDVGDKESLDFGVTDSFSISVWIKNDGCSYDAIVVKGGNFGRDVTTGYRLRLYEDKLHFQIVDADGNMRYISGDTNATGDGWHHVVAVRNASEAKLYVYLDGASDATEVADTTSATLETAESFLIGCFPPQGGYFFDGLIDEVMVFKRALAPREIRQLYQKGNKRHGYFKDLYAGNIQVEQDIFCSGDIEADGKITGNPVDPSFVLYDREPRQGIIELAKGTIPPNKQDGAALFFNKDTKRLEIYVQSEGKFYDLQGNLIFSLLEPDVATTFKTRYRLDRITGEVREVQRVDARRWRVKEEYKFDSETGKFYKRGFDEVNRVITMEEVTKDEAIAFE